MENVSFDTFCMSRCTRVDLPDPDGAEMMKTDIIGCFGSSESEHRRSKLAPQAFGWPCSHSAVRSFQIQRLLANLLDAGFGGQREIRDSQPQLPDAVGLGQNRVGLPVHLLQQEIQLLADFATRVQDFLQLPGMNLKPRNFLADVAAVGQ